MSNVITFPPTDDGPHLQGKFICLSCTNEWEGVAPVGTWDHLECPNCHRFWGQAKHGVIPPDAVWHCNCGCTTFWLTPSGAMCRQCGVRSIDWAN